MIKKFYARSMLRVKSGVLRIIVRVFYVKNTQKTRVLGFSSFCNRNFLEKKVTCVILLWIMESESTGPQFHQSIFELFEWSRVETKFIKLEKSR